MSRVAIIKTNPQTILKDIEKIMQLADFQNALDPGVVTILKENISWHLPFLSANTTPWQLEGVIRTLKKAKYHDLVCVANKTVVTNPFKGARLNRLLSVFKKYNIPILYNFRKEDIELLIQKLKLLNLNFYPVKIKSGFKNGESCGYALFSKVSDGTVYNFFRLIGFHPPKEIEKCITGKKGRYSKLHYLKDKWPKKEEWIKIISNIPQLGKILGLKEIRKNKGLTQKELGRIIGISREAIRDFENGKRNLRVENLKKLLEVFELEFPIYGNDFPSFSLKI